MTEFVRNLIRERTMAGLKAVRARGRFGGRSRKLDVKKTAQAYRLYDEKKHTVIEICQMLNVTKPTLYAYLARRKKDPDEETRLQQMHTTLRAKATRSKDLRQLVEKEILERKGNTRGTY